MNRDRIRQAGILLLVILGALVGRRLLPAEPATEGQLFRQQLWITRGLDLIVQAWLVFAGALGIAALLPRAAEEEET
jgi:hypothetical protein